MKALSHKTKSKRILKYRCVPQIDFQIQKTADEDIPTQKIKFEGILTQKQIKKDSEISLRTSNRLFLEKPCAGIS